MRLIPILAAAAVLAAPGLAIADPFTVLPNGDLVFNAEVSTTGRFHCGAAQYLPVPCLELVDGGVTLGSGDDTLTLGFSGVDKSLVVGNTLVPVTLGEIESTVTGNGLIFDTPPNPNHTLVSFDLGMSQSSPVDSGPKSISWAFGAGDGTVLPLIAAPWNYIEFPTGPNPPGYSYSGIVYTVPHFNIPGFDSTTAVGAQAGVVPEPATILLVGSGLAGAAYARRRKRRG